jgi:hypothetical protein
MGKIVAVVAAKREQVGGGAPMFFDGDAARREKLAFTLEKILDCMVHDVGNETFILVDHGSTENR